MKPKKLLLIVVGAVLGLVLISNAIMSSYANAPGERLKAPVAQQMTAASSEYQEPASLQSIVSSARIVFNKTFPDQNEVEWRPEERTVVIDVWPNGYGAEMADYALRDIKYLNDWNGICGSMSEISGDLREQFVKNGYDDVSVVVNMYDPDDIGLLLASARDGDLLYDVVASTPTGERIAEVSNSSTRSLGTEHVYILNTSSDVFHLPGCSAAAQISAENRRDVTASRDSLIAQGYRPCGTCDP